MKFLIALVLLGLTVMGLAQPMAAKASAADVKKLQTLEKNYNVAKAALVKKPKDAAVKKAFVKSAVLFGHESMISPVLPARIKYRQALRIYREALKLDPKNKVAKTESDLIIKIYKDMGRPVPDN